MKSNVSLSSASQTQNQLRILWEKFWISRCRRDLRFCDSNQAPDSVWAVGPQIILWIAKVFKNGQWLSKGWREWIQAEETTWSKLWKKYTWVCDETEAHWCPQVIGEIFTAKLEVDGSMVYFKQKGIYYIGNGAYLSKLGCYTVKTAHQIWRFHW